MGLRVWRVDELAEALRDPASFERWSPVTGTPSLAIDLGSGDASDEDVARLEWLPAVSIGLGGRDASPAGRRVDVRVPGQAEAERVAEAVAAHPLASVALAQLLRRSEGLALEHALLAESLVYSTLQAGPEFAAWRASYRAKPSTPSREPPLRLVREGAHLAMHMNRPEKRNAFSAAMRDALCEALALVHRDRGIERVSWQGDGPAFCSGGDLDEFGTFPDPATANAIRATRSPGLLLAGCADRVHAFVHGACIGAGVELPALCVRVVAARDAFFALPEVGMGLVPGAGGTASLPRRIGRQRTAWMALTGERVTATTARAWGLVDEVARA